MDLSSSTEPEVTQTLSPVDSGEECEEESGKEESKEKDSESDDQKCAVRSIASMAKSTSRLRSLPRVKMNLSLVDMRAIITKAARGFKVDKDKIPKKLFQGLYGLNLDAHFFEPNLTGRQYMEIMVTVASY